MKINIEMGQEKMFVPEQNNKITIGNYKCNVKWETILF